MKPCATCNEVKSLTEFYKNPGCKDGHFKHCKVCDRKRAKLWWDSNQDKVLLRKYGITEQQFHDMLSDQCGRCAICATHFETSRKTHIDHCHTSKKVRGVLCHTCNVMIGMAKDSVQTLENAIYYLNHHSTEEL